MKIRQWQFCHLYRGRWALLLFFCFTALGCVTETTSPEESRQVMDNGSYSLNPQQLRQHMGRCATQFAMGAARTNVIFDYTVKNQHIFYKTDDDDLRAFLKICAGEKATFTQDDKGTVDVVGV